MSGDENKNNVYVTSADENDMNDVDDEDDFSEFGGFEMADVPAAAAEAQPLPAALQVGPNPWILMAVQHPTETSALVSQHGLSSDHDVLDANSMAPRTDASAVAESPVPVTNSSANEVVPTSVSKFDSQQSKQSIDSSISSSLQPTYAALSDSLTSHNTSFEAIQLEVTKQQLQKQATMYAQLRDQHTAQMQQLQETSQSTVALIAEQYKELSSASVRNCEVECRQQIKEYTEHEKVALERVLHSQQELIQKTLDEERATLSNKLDEQLQRQRTEQQEQYETFLKEEKELMRLEISRALQEEADRNAKLFEDAVQAERERTRKTLQDERENMLQLIQEERDRSVKLLAEACEFERRQAKEAIEAAVGEQQSRIAKLMEETLESAREQMKVYVEEQRQADHSSRLHLLSSVDLLLSTACQQLKILKAPPDNS